MTTNSLPHHIADAINQLGQDRSDGPLCCYLFDLEALRNRIRQMSEALPSNVALFYAAKANPMPEILATLAPYVAGFEAASGGELAHLAQQDHHKPLIFGGPGKLESELKTALELGIDAIHVESLTELKHLIRLAKALDCQAPIFLRMNIDIGSITLSKLAMGGRPTPFGLDSDELEHAIALIQQNPCLQLKGFHFHLMSHQLEVDKHLALMKCYFDAVKAWQAQYQLPPLAINLGGGMGINYTQPDQHFDWLNFCERLTQLIQQEGMADTPLRFECGRFISAPCGYYVTEIIDLKRNLGEYFAVCRGGTHHFRTPAAQSHNHPFVIIDGNIQDFSEEKITDELVTLVGQLCTPKDVFSRAQSIAELKIGDYVVFTLAGAYSWNISHQNFLMHPAPKFHYLN
ncbi:L-glutamyl-[BtrI acyl-carrier protein] decarboxylase [Marinomonas aquimarina]|uniref:L-glutamyl-[BtrI acyl-carrier protein] decarboxylase n=1 Tax=Marinomonas aquimarina TaxID=295068 RepID=A0A1A8TF68_9GAMM|nr:type III PLP-dependent enzyme [Marinomonas aquimarina]SBS30789.1 L-glutamyl-[BtrI acyl-carrier protein] decarboxylase [Marinomonas aquimarina]